ncbi:MAG TPA: efflux RND transporter periplasmic adaptor subunit [Gemmatales bacterium]|nr:efflux RND transporter periplasmic adaptor subunit [Gemmatales bacterium]
MATETAPPLSRGLGLVFLSTFILHAGCQQETGPREEVVRPVKTQIVFAGEDIRTRTFPGRVEASRKVELAFQVPGVLAKLPVKEGQKLSMGDLIAQLRQEEFEARLQALQAQLDQARATLRALQAGDRPQQRLRLEAAVRAAAAKMQNALTERDRYAQLLRSRAVARADFDLRETQYRVAKEEHAAAVQMLEKGMVAREEDLDAQEAQVRGLEARVVEAHIALRDSTLLAPYDGIVAQRFVEEGQSIQAKSLIVRFQDVDEIEIAVDVPETVMLADIRSADIVSLRAEFSGAPGLEFPVQIREIAQNADPTTQTFRVTAAMKAPENLTLRPGMTATVTAAFRRAAILGSNIHVPANAVVRDAQGQAIVWLLGPENKLERQAVKLGEARGGRLEILDGLQPGARVVVAGAAMLRDGMKVRDLGDELGGSQ